MKKIALVLLLLIALISMTGCSQYMAKNWGGEMTIELEPGVGLEMITWKDDILWILTRERAVNEVPITHTFYESNDWNALEGTIYIVEK